MICYLSLRPQPSNSKTNLPNKKNIKLYIVQWQNNNIVIDAFASFKLYHLIQWAPNQRRERKKHQQTKQADWKSWKIREWRANKRKSKKKENYNVLWTIVYISYNACENQWSVQWKATEKKRKISMVCALCSGSGMIRACDFQKGNKSYQYIWFSWMRWLPHVLRLLRFFFVFFFFIIFFLLLLSPILHTWHFVYIYRKIWCVFIIVCPYLSVCLLLSSSPL